MNTEYSIVDAFASPIGVDSAIASSIIAGKFFEQTRRRVVLQLESQSLGLLAKDVAAVSISKDASWRPELGLAASACNAGKTSLAALQLLILSVPFELETCVQVESQSHLLLDGWLLPVQGEVTIRASQGALRIESNGGDFGLALDAGCWIVISGPVDRVWQSHRLASNQPRYIIETAITGSSRIFPKLRAPKANEKLTQENSVEATPKTITMLQLAIDKIDSSSAAYSEWLACSVDGIILTIGEAAVGMSSPELPGLVALSANGSMYEYAERLTSAACNQKLFQLALVFPLTEPGLEEVHYIPSRRSYTTARRALAAAHEHINAILILSHLAAKSDDIAAITSKIEKRKLMVFTECFPALEKSTILTAAGKRLWIRLRELLLVEISQEGIGLSARENVSSMEENAPTEVN